MNMFENQLPLYRRTSFQLVCLIFLHPRKRAESLFYKFKTHFKPEPCSWLSVALVGRGVTTAPLCEINQCNGED